MTTIGQKIEEYFDYLGYTYEEIGQATNISTKELLLIFKDEREVSPKELKAFATLFNTNEAELSNGKSLDETVGIHTNNTANFPEEDQKQLQKFSHYLQNTSKK